MEQIEIIPIFKLKRRKEKYKKLYGRKSKIKMLKRLELKENRKQTQRIRYGINHMEII